MTCHVSPQDKVSVMHEGHVRRARVIVADGKWLIYRLIGFDAADLILARDAEGTHWARGWDEETQGALRAADSLKDPT
jgi:hypothetical protein